MINFLYKADYTKKDSRCHGTCDQIIKPGVFRIGVMIQHSQHDKLIPSWYHSECFFKNIRNLTSIAQIDGYDKLAAKDQKTIRNNIKTKTVVAKSKKVQEPYRANIFLNLLKKQESCFKCNRQIKKSDSCFKDMMEDENANEEIVYFHFKCLNQDIYTFDTQDESDSEDEIVDNEIVEVVKTASKRKHVNAESGVNAKKAKQIEENDDNKVENQIYINYQTAILEANMQDTEIKEILTANSQRVFKNEVHNSREYLVTALADTLAFGALVNSCPKCVYGKLVLDPSEIFYKCTGAISEYQDCPFRTQKPNRVAMTIPIKFQGAYRFLKKYKYNTERKRRYEMKLSDFDKQLAENIENTQPTNSGDAKNDSKIKITLKNGLIVESGLKLDAHVMRDSHSNDPMCALLTLVDLKARKNKFYKLQLLKHDVKPIYYVFRAWGEIGDRGDYRLSEYAQYNSALDFFEEVYYKRTGNKWSEHGSFVKKAFKYYQVDVDHGVDRNDTELRELFKDSYSKLGKPVQELIELIFDIDLFKQVLIHYELDENKMPLCKLSKNQLNKALDVLSDLKCIVKSNAKDEIEINELNNRFYTLIPHSCLLTIDTVDLINKKIEMLNDLLNIELAYELMKRSKDDEDPINQHYQNLNCNIDVLEVDTNEFEIINEYIRNTHVHADFKIYVEQIFKVKRHTEQKNKLNNHMLLWHGSRLSNFASILSNGLKIAPVEAPQSGNMFGKGIYFADMVSKSGNYCCTTPNNPDGLLLLCDVALGKVMPLTEAHFIKKLPDGVHSVKGVGATQPNPSAIVIDNDGVKIPIGKAVPSGCTNTALLFNEFIVYDESQVQIKYLVKFKSEFARNIINKV